MGKAITIVRTPVGTLERKISKFIHWNFHSIWLVSPTNPAVNTTALENSPAGCVAHRGDLFRRGSSEAHFQSRGLWVAHET